MIPARSLILICVLFLKISTACCQNASLAPLDSLAAQVLLSIRSVTMERAFVKTDKSFYQAGEKIWFRSFLINTPTHKLSHKSNILFVDLVNENDSVIDRQLLPASQFKTDGRWMLSDSLPTGFYWIRAYSKDMALHHPEYIGIQSIYVINPAKPAERVVQRLNHLPTPPIKKGKLRMDFFPEGGAVIGGANTVVAFRITDESGWPVKLKGQVKNDLDSVVADFSSDKYGLGKISFFSWSWRKYTVSIFNETGEQQIFPLPPIDQA